MFLLLPSSGACEVLNDMQLEADEIIALRHFIIPKQIHDWWQGAVAAGSFCPRGLMIQFLRWTPSASVTRTTSQTHRTVLKLIIYESFWSKLLGWSQERFILFNPRFLVYLLFVASSLPGNKYVKLDCRRIFGVTVRHPPNKVPHWGPSHRLVVT